MNIINYYNELIICRACENSNDLIELDKNVFKKFQFVTGLNIDITTDELPRWICSVCVDSLESFHTFKTRCENTDRKLREAIAQKRLRNENCDIKLDYVSVDQINVEAITTLDQQQLKQEHEIQIDEETHERIAKGLESSEEETAEQQIIKNEPIEYLEIVIADSDDKQKETDIKKKVYPRKKVPKTYKCETCSDEFDDFIEFNTHKKTHGNQRFQCDICQLWFPRLCFLKVHQIAHTETKDYDCNLCSKTYKHRGNLDRHINVFHKKKKGYVCDICGKGFSQSAILKLHYTVHQEESNFECEYCDKKFKNQMYLNRHKQIHLPKEEKKSNNYQADCQKKVLTFVCAVCGKISKSQILHRSHLRIHSGEKPYECPTCQKKFTFVQSLQKHLLVHTGAKPYKCETCGFSFRQLNHLKGHRLIHSGVKKFKCMVCEKTFALGSNLKVHMRIHTNETPFHCTKCPKKFYASNALKKHTLVHK